jgi:hypothetical protein
VGTFLLRTTKRKRPRKATNESMGNAVAMSMKGWRGFMKIRAKTGTF